MVSAKSIVFGSKKTYKLVENLPEIAPFSVQFFGSEPQILSEAIKRLGETAVFDIVDINMGCPMPKIVKNGEGAALMQNPVLAGRLIEAAVKASPRPVTVKIRKGFTAASQNAVEMALVSQESGAAAVAVHGRTRCQFYTGTADWEAIARVKAAVKIPIIGNGDIFTPEDALLRLKESACDALLIARGALGNPWLFPRTLEYLQKGILPRAPPFDQIIKTALRHASLTQNILELRKHLAWYTKGMHGSAEARKRIMQAKTLPEMQEILGGIHS
jgi:nifR3 family TIM-barrel protein